MVNSTSDLAAALRERLAMIRDEDSRRNPQKHMARLRTISEKIDNLTAALPKPINPQLAHFLERNRGGCCDALSRNSRIAELG